MLKSLFERCLNANYIHTIKGSDYAMEIDGNTLYLLFECSDGKEDWISNFAFPAKPYKQMEVEWRCHGGFLEVWKDVRDDIESYVAEALTSHPEITHIMCVGYSHGAAVAVLATEDMEYLYGDKYIVHGVGFGAPRVLFGNVPAAVKKRLKRFLTVRNVPDIVTHVPPLFLGFRNAGAMLKIGNLWEYNLIDAHRPESYKNELQEWVM